MRIQDGASADLSGVTTRLESIRLGSVAGGGAEVVGTALGDKITSGVGDDVITGGLGGDRLTGGDGHDTFVYTGLRDIGVYEKEEILDFQHGTDTIDLSAIDTNKRLDGDQAFSFVGSSAFSGGGDAEVRFEDIGQGVLRVEFDMNHDKVADYSMLVHAATLTANDFVL